MAEPAAAGPTIAIERWAALASALVVTAGVLAFGWSSFIVVGLYWLENVVIGLFTLARMIAAWRLGTPGVRPGVLIFLVVFFTLHYGLFCFGHGVFIVALLGGVPLAATPGIPNPLVLLLDRLLAETLGWVGVAAVLAFVAADFARWLIDARAGGPSAGGSSAGRPRANELMLAPYRRIVVLHIALLGGAFLMQMLGLPQATVLVLVGLKLAFDLREVRRPFTFAWRRPA
ncbi:MAG: DUF6498-containing protein [Burkholderiaceae bacterium]|nr:DUF6498-containing protein [Burkholderiaceae bacterium]